MRIRILTFLFFIYSLVAFGQLKEIPRKVESSATTYLEIVMDGGLGFTQLPLFTTGRETIYLSPGGGINFGLRFAQRINKFEYSAGFIFAYSTLSRAVSNADGSYRRFLIDPQAKFILRVKENQNINPGAGIGIYPGGVMDIDARSLVGGDHRVFKYKTSVGYFLSAEYEWTKMQTVVVGVGLRYYNIRYDLQSLTVNNQSIPVNRVSYEYAALDGSGIDFTVRLRIKL